MIGFLNVAPLGDLNQEHVMPKEVQEKKSKKVVATNGVWAEFFYDGNGNCTHLETGMRPPAPPEPARYVPQDVVQLAQLIMSQGVATDMCADHGTAVQQCEPGCFRSKPAAAPAAPPAEQK